MSVGHNKDGGERLRKAIAVLKRQPGMLRLRELLALGIHPETIQALKASGQLEARSRGLYQFRDAEPLGEPDLVIVAKRVQGAVFCLLTALAFHELTTHTPHEVHIALKRGRRRPRLEHPPLRVYWWGTAALTSGVERYERDGTDLLITNPERSVADAFHYRNELGLDLAVESLRAWRDRRGARPDALLSAARVVHADRILKPYLEALL